ncbi:sensor histidine kinase [Candidatus Solirubrobacter pratensis]|uniref:sensor histidine kinase n=1 Tax=Candidatus Solirubrobacter pratensis TaxID=1298857 RepID=UPI00040F4526|nr:ATP-binding protein [Candidatus Solirubrobacter pratensis]
MAAAKVPVQRDLLSRLAAGTAGVVGAPFLRRLVAELGAALDAEVAFVAELVDERPGYARTIAGACAPGIELREGCELALEGTPCEHADACELLRVPENARERYPRDAFLAAHKLNGYIALALRGADGRAIGHIAIVSTRRLELTDEELAALQIFAARAGAEVERRRHEAALRAQTDEVAGSRAGALQAADEERRRIGRELHDGAQQRLVGLERGLGGALAALAVQSPVPLRIVSLPARRLPPVVEATVWLLVRESLSNAIKHAQATDVRVEVVQHGRTLVAEIVDDGVGGARGDHGTGLQALAARVESLGGRLMVDSPPGEGTRLAATIPLAPWRTARDPFLEFGHADDGGRGRKKIEELLAGKRTTAVSLAREWELEGGPPRIGQRLPVFDHMGRRHAVVEVERVALVPFGDVDPATIDPEPGVDDWHGGRRLAYDACREEMAALLGDPGWRLTDKDPMVILWYRRVDQTTAAEISGSTL